MPQRRQHGFSLIELMVVLLIVGVLAGSVSLGIEAARAGDAERAIARLQHGLEAAAERAEVRGRPLAVDFFGDGYRYSELGADGRWHPLEESPLLVAGELPPPLRTLRLARPQGADEHMRLVFGSRPPAFVLALANGSEGVLLEGDPSGRVRRIGGPDDGGR